MREDSSGIGKEKIEFGTVKFEAHKIEGVLAAIRPMLTRYNLDLEPNLIERVYTGNRCDVMIDWEFVCLDDEAQVRKIRWAGAGNDNSDKGYAKATTNSLKEMLKKRFLITDRDDAKEEEEKVEHQTDDGVRRGDMEKVKDQRKAAIRQWASTFKAAIDSASTEKEIDRLYRDNAEQLGAGDLEPVTKEFFDELKIAAKGRLLAKAKTP
jgi:hypothetical protein